MARPAVYPGSMDALIKEWDEKYRTTWKERGRDGLFGLMIANGQCARLPQELTNVGHTSRWQPGERVIDVARTLKPGTVIANFLFEYGKAWYPNSHGWHAALFIKAEGFSMTTGRPNKIWMFDQWRHPKEPRWPSPRGVNVWPEEHAKTKEPADKADEFFVVMVP